LKGVIKDDFLFKGISIRIFPLESIKEEIPFDVDRNIYLRVSIALKTVIARS
jgi:hypothetical protein